MELKHYIDNIEIDEPIGFDNLKTSIKRGEYHGMSAEVSVGTLEFYGIGAYLLRSAYNESVENKPVYRVTLNGEELYSGVCDMASYTEHSGDYCSVSCNVGEIGVKTTFNSRTDTEIDLNGTKSVGGVSLSTFNYHEIALPKRTIVYTNRMKQDKTTTTEGTQNNGIYYKDDVPMCFLNLAFTGGSNVNEFGTMEPNLYIAGKDVYKNKSDQNFDLDGYVEPLFRKGTEFETKFGADASYSLTIRATVKVTIKGDFFAQNPSKYPTVYFVPYLTNSNCVKNTSVYPVGAAQSVNGDGEGDKTVTLYFNYSASKLTHNTLYLGIKVYHENHNETAGLEEYYYNNETLFNVEISADSYVEMELSSVRNEYVKAKMLTVFEALSKTIETISDKGLSLKSEVYGAPFSFVSPQSTYGALSRKLLTTGYLIRDIADKPFNVSFKTLIESLSMQDCIGWCFEGDKVRVEDWKWFYKDDLLLEIENPKEISKTVDTDYVCSSLEIGYKKYADNDDIKAMDSIHGERTYTSNITTISKSVKKQCEFIADNYAIELTRRARFLESEEDEFKYDENIFVFSANCGMDNNLKIDADGESYDNVSYETYNVKLSPAQCALRWLDFIFALQGQTEFRLTTGKLNLDAKATPKNNSNYLSDNSSALGGDRGAFKENSMLKSAYALPIVKPETIKIKYPVTVGEYKAIIANPYGIIRMDGADYWIKEFQYSFVDGEAEFSLIPKR